MYRLMIVDDEEIILDSLYNDLCQQFKDVEVYKASSGAKALELLRRMSFDVVITDISMPKMDGLELLDIIARLWPDCRVMMLTAYNDFNYAYRAMRHPRVRYLLKIESYERIRASVKEMIDEVQEQRRGNELILSMDRRLYESAFSLRNYLLNRIVVQGDRLPTPKEAEDLGVSIHTGSPVLLALGQLDPHPGEEYAGVFPDISGWLETQLGALGMNVLWTLSSGQAVWLIQAGEQNGEPPEESFARIRECMGNLPAMVEEKAGRSLSLVLAGAFDGWGRVHRLYQQARLLLERMDGEAGLVILPPGETRAPLMPGECFPDMNEMPLLWEMLKAGKARELKELMEEKLAPVREAQDFKKALPIPSVTAVTFLLSEAVRVYAPQGTPEFDLKRFMAGDYDTGEQWLGQALALTALVADMRAHIGATMSAWVVKAVNEFIGEHFRQDLKLTDIAEAVNYNPSYLSRCYKEQTGKNIMAHIHEVRMRHAAKLLRETTMRVNEVAENCGICSTRYFNIVFKKAAGMTPNTFRQKNR